MAERRSAGQRGKEPRSAYRRRVIVLLAGHAVPPRGNPARNAFEGWRRLTKLYPGARVEPLITSVSPKELERLIAAATESDADYEPADLAAYVAVEVPVGVKPEEVAEELAGWDGVERSYAEGGPVPPPVVAPADDPRQVNQGYQDSAPSGIDAEYAWGFAGGDGQGIGFVDLEQGWTLNHEDLAGAGVTLVSGVSNAYMSHGTSVLGEVVAVDNTLGCVGIAPGASARVCSEWRTASSFNRVDAILDAIAAMSFGDVMLLEMQASYGGFSLVPAEAEPAVFDVIRLATALGVVVIEAAANGANDLDAFTDGGAQVLNRSSPDFKDSGAIMVGAGSSTAPHTRLSFSNFGSRVDCYGWGHNVDTTASGSAGTSLTSYTTTFGGTSSASPIVAGAALAVQGIAEQSASIGYRFGPLQLREMLSDATTGTASNDPATDRIGVMPDLRQIIDGVLNVTADVYIRDFVGDHGDPHAGAVSASPDIILRPAEVADPQAAFGQGSGTENLDTLGFEAEAGQDNFIYVRALNRGGADAANVEATVYWSPPASLVTPDLWTLIGTVTLPEVPAGDVLTASDALPWPSAAIPAPGHYCFVGLLGTEDDPAPERAEFLVWDNFISFIRNNGNVTWRNFNVVNNVPPSRPPKGVPKGFVPLPFLAPGPPDEGRRLGLQILARLPQDARVLLEAPLYLVEALGLRVPREGVKGAVARIPIGAQGLHSLGEALFPARSRAALRLFVDIPSKRRDRSYRIAVRQTYEGLEVGRLTWVLAPAKKRS
jgi:serine protease